MSFIYKNKFALPSLPLPGSFNGQSILITGASGGLGLATAIHFVNLGASSVIVTARSTAKGEAAKATIETQTGTLGKGIVKIMLLDMSTLASTKTFAEQVRQEVKKIDYVLLNAGLLNTKFQEGEDGFEETIQVNVLSTALLGLLLLPWIKEAGHGKAHMGFVTSGLHRGVAIDGWPKADVLGHLSKSENWPQGGMYATSKLLEQYVVNEIAKLAVGSDGKPQVIVNPMCPGMKDCPEFLVRLKGC
jgi:NAD(P)-dependent dehydrogenase (short-subunit alcohol dehydrogenase family)